MFHSLFKNFSLPRHSITGLENQPFCLLQLNFLSTSLKKSPKSIAKYEAKKLFTVNYLMDTFGFSPDRALSSCRYVVFGTSEKPNSVISFFQNHGFTKTQISKLAQKCPSVLVSNHEKTLLPKIEFFRSLGFSEADIASVLSVAPQIFQRSVEKQLMQNVGFLRGLFPLEEEILVILKRFVYILCEDLDATLVPNIEYLKDLGVSVSNITSLLKNQPRTLSMNHIKFKKIVDNAKEMGFNPEKFVFLWAIHTFASMNKATLEKKMQIYESWGFSEEQIFQAFRKQPHFLTHSADKIMNLMNYLVDIMGFESFIVIERPQLMGLSLRNRIIPRCSVYQVLSDKNLVPKDFNVVRFLESPEKTFLIKFVVPFKAQVPDLLMLYKKNSPCLL